MHYRHTDNINYFLVFVRNVGLPEVGDLTAVYALVLMILVQSFVFDTIDLYEKKNIPKVIYCIHALRYEPLLMLYI